jgi:hypothetical protein
MPYRDASPTADIQIRIPYSVLRHYTNRLWLLGKPD